jgi:hypothetical protein
VTNTVGILTLNFHIDVPQNGHFQRMVDKFIEEIQQAEGNWTNC